MVWGMPLPLGPYGEYEGEDKDHGNGWRRRLRAYFREQLSDEERAAYEDGNGNGEHCYPGTILDKFVSEVGSKGGSPDRPVVTAIADHEPPSFFQFSDGNKSPPSVISLPSRIWAVSEPFKTCIEWMEPGVHQFFPIEIRNKRGSVYSTNFYIFVVGQYFESFVPDESAKDLARSNGSTVDYGIPQSKKDVVGMALSREKFGKAHVWRERVFGEWLTCFSDELMAEVKDAGLKMPGCWQMKVV